VLEALAAGVPVAVTPVVSEGLPLEVAPAVKVAASAAEFAEVVVALLGLAPTARRTLADQAPLQRLSWSERLAPVSDLVAQAASRRRARR
jgi:hypothetical protein